VALLPRHTHRSSWGLFFHSGEPQKGYRVGWIGSGFPLPIAVSVTSIVASFKEGGRGEEKGEEGIPQGYSILDTELILLGVP
jgi:hypothetical protein